MDEDIQKKSKHNRNNKAVRRSSENESRVALEDEDIDRIERNTIAYDALDVTAYIEK